MTDAYRIRTDKTWAEAKADYLDGFTAEEVCRRHARKFLRRRPTPRSAARFVAGWSARPPGEVDAPRPGPKPTPCRRPTTPR